MKRTAHDRLKASFWPSIWAATSLSAVVHFAVLANARFEAPDGFLPSIESAMEFVAVRLVDLEIPRPPDPIGRPAVPVLGTELALPDEITIEEVRFEEPPIELPPPPPPARSVDLSAEPAFTPHDVRPRIRNQREFERALVRLYPDRLQRAGIGGVTILWIFIDETGAVKNTRLIESSGYDELDEAAIRAVHEKAEFSPALSRSVPVPVWVQLPIRFQTVTRGGFQL